MPFDLQALIAQLTGQNPPSVATPPILPNGGGGAGGYQGSGFSYPFTPPAPQPQPPTMPNAGPPPLAGNPQAQPPAPVTNPLSQGASDLLQGAMPQPNAPVPPEEAAPQRRNLSPMIDQALQKLLAKQNDLIDQINSKPSITDAINDFLRSTPGKRDPNFIPTTILKQKQAQQNLAAIQGQISSLSQAKRDEDLFQQAQAMMQYNARKQTEIERNNLAKNDIAQQRADTYAASAEGRQKIAEFRANLQKMTDMANVDLKEAQASRQKAAIQWDQLKAQFGNEFLAARSINPENPMAVLSKIEYLKHPFQNAEASALGFGGIGGPAGDATRKLLSQSGADTGPTGYQYKTKGLDNPTIRNFYAGRIWSGSLTPEQAAAALVPGRGIASMPMRQQALLDINHALLEAAGNMDPQELAGNIQKNKAVYSGLKSAFSNLEKNTATAETQHKQLNFHLDEANRLYAAAMADPENRQKFQEAVSAIQKNPDLIKDENLGSSSAFVNALKNKARINFTDNSALGQLFYHVNAARNEAAKLQTTVSGGGSAGVSDSARHELDSLYNVNMPPEQFAAVTQAVRASGDKAIQAKNDILTNLGEATKRLSIITPPVTGNKNPGGAPTPLVQRNKKTGEYRYSTDGGRSWQPGQPPPAIGNQ